MQKSSDNNTEIVYKDPPYSCYKFQLVWLASFFKQSLGLAIKWHVVKVLGHLSDIQAANYVDDLLNQLKIMKQTQLTEGPEVIVPLSLQANRLEELQLLKNFVLEERIKFITSNY